MRLGGLIETLRDLPGDLPVRYDDGTYPQEFASYRGYYENLTLVPGDEPATVKDLLMKAEAANGATFQGWKGGDYTMALDTPVWADDYGNAYGHGIGMVTASDTEVVLHIIDAGDYGGF